MHKAFAFIASNSLAQKQEKEKQSQTGWISTSEREGEIDSWKEQAAAATAPSNENYGMRMSK